MKKTFSEHLLNITICLIFLIYVMAFAGWWYISPKGFSFDHPRFWSNSVIPIAVMIASFMVCIGFFRPHKGLLSLLLPCFVAATLAFTVSGWILYPISMRVIFIVPLLCWSGFLLFLTIVIIKYHRLKRNQWIVSGCLMCCSVLAGAALPWSQQSAESATSPLNPAESMVSSPSLNKTASPMELTDQVTVYPRNGRISMNNNQALLDVSPLLRFYSRSPDRCWILFAPAKDRRGSEAVYKGIRRITDGLHLEYEHDGYGMLELTQTEPHEPLEINTSTVLANDVYSHLNTFTKFTVEVKKQVFVSFSPCPEERIEVTAFDYPFGRPARLAYWDPSGIFRVVQAKSAEKGPFKTLAEGPLDKDQPLEITLFDEDKPLYRVTLHDWATQASVQLSPTAGWGLPENAIEFCLDEEDKRMATFFVTLASTSTGRGFDTVGHKAGTYRNHLTIEDLTLK